MSSAGQQQDAGALFVLAERPASRTRRGSSRSAGRVPAAQRPVARVMVDVPLPHLDRPFDYLVPESLDEQVPVGSRVRVRFAGRLVDAYVLERCAESEHPGSLTWVERAVGGEPILTADTAALFRAVADRWAGTFVDVARLGVPARHARAESQPAAAETAAGLATAQVDDAAWSHYRAGAAFLRAVTQRRAARAVWTALPGECWPDRIAEAVEAALSAGRGALALAPDGRDLERLHAAVASRVGEAAVVTLAADLGPEERYRRWLAVRRGMVRAVVGTRAAAYAPVADLGLLAMWDDGDDSYVEPRAPYAHAREVLALRSVQTGAALLLGASARSAEAQLLVETGWAHEIGADRAAVRAAAPRVRPVGDETEQRRDPGAVAARLPSLAWRTARETLEAGGSVLVQVPRRGYVPALACARDRTPARCTACSGPLTLPASGSVPHCRWCGRPAADWRCPQCGQPSLRAVVVGDRRTAEELGRAFPGVPVVTSGGDRILASVRARAQLVVATPGAEPTVAGGYGAALLLDGWALLGRADLRAGEEAVRRWMAAAALVAPNGSVVVGAEGALPAVQALVRWDPAGYAARELADRSELGFPPAVRMAALTGAPEAVSDLLGRASLPAAAEVIGPVAAGTDSERTLIRVPRPLGTELATALKLAASARSLRRSGSAVKLELDPFEVL